MTSLPPVLLFDLDDTLVVFGSASGDPWRELGAEFAPKLGVELEDLLSAVRVSADHFWSDPETRDAGRLDMLGSRRTIVARALRALENDRASVGEAYADAFTWIREERVAPFPGAIETLEALRARGHRLGLVSNGSGEFQRRKLDRYDLGGYFEDIRIEGEQGIGKPHAKVFELALRAFGIRASEAWMVGDNLVADIQGAQAVGLHAVWVDARRTGLPETAVTTPDRIIRSVRELVEPA